MPSSHLGWIPWDWVGAGTPLVMTTIEGDYWLGTSGRDTQEAGDCLGRRLAIMWVAILKGTFTKEMSCCGSHLGSRSHILGSHLESRLCPDGVFPGGHWGQGNSVVVAILKPIKGGTKDQHPTKQCHILQVAVLEEVFGREMWHRQPS